MGRSRAPSMANRKPQEANRWVVDRKLRLHRLRKIRRSQLPPSTAAP